MAFDGYLFWGVRSGVSGEPVVSTQSQSGALNLSRLDEVVQNFMLKAERYQKYRVEKPKIPDPAI